MTLALSRSELESSREAFALIAEKIPEIGTSYALAGCWEEIERVLAFVQQVRKAYPP